MYHGNVNYNVAAMYHPSALDIWGKKDMQICINEFASEQEKMLHEQVAIAYTFAYSAILAAPKCKDAIVNLMDNVLQFPMSKVLNDNEPDLGTPWGLAKVRVDEIHDYAKTDGWNADGSLAHKYNKMPYSDFKLGEYMRYRQKKEEEIVSKKDCEKVWKWEPLLESNGAGYFTRQEHVTPFAGFTGRLYGLTSEEYNSFMVPPPE
ncbi:hypothetical protein CTEN210_17984 [Chaetoceros tenuissimus]|uniref:DUF6851 domain-containing protein n=1 Tax=Chaetoceros tenuissimus TaxID=426638 RepID=A0AAD3DBT9_9STRA|nr:hypothetical protein CTEN210_17984 [Chaetoceros tenuissimus]